MKKFFIDSKNEKGRRIDSKRESPNNFTISLDMHLLHRKDIWIVSEVIRERCDFLINFVSLEKLRWWRFVWTMRFLRSNATVVSCKCIKSFSQHCNSCRANGWTPCVDALPRCNLRAPNSNPVAHRRIVISISVRGHRTTIVVIGGFWSPHFVCLAHSWCL